MSKAVQGFVLGVLWCAASGCSPYVLRGKVIDGPTSDVQVVGKNDERLGYLGLGEATVQLTIDPDSLGRRELPPQAVSGDGTFALPIDEAGAGFLEYDVGVVVRREGYDSAVKTFRLPGGGKRLLVTLVRGADRYRPREDPLREAEEFLKE